MADSVRLDIITPERLFYRGEIELVIARTLAGDEGFMAHHTWACKLLDTGELWIQEAGSKDFRIAAISGGYIDVKESIVIFTDAAEWPEEIDVERAKAAGEKATEWLKTQAQADADTTDILKARIDLHKSTNRMNVAGGGIRKKR
ncbi:MAG: F0F1 ATP synthase subunit epsilon [Clostridiales Family XIII bacterium]|jgi:F-type H+-transporting ATPase subunit epsilon|nr:F0F1 ATP synthase subunit epsilon [Clostridiales Family XIII bacterium]